MVEYRIIDKTVETDFIRQIGNTPFVNSGERSEVQAVAGIISTIVPTIQKSLIKNKRIFLTLHPDKGGKKEDFIRINDIKEFFEDLFKYYPFVVRGGRRTRYNKTKQLNKRQTREKKLNHSGGKIQKSKKTVKSKKNKSTKKLKINKKNMKK